MNNSDVKLNNKSDYKDIGIKIFIVSQLVFFIIWLMDIIINGISSKQWSIFFELGKDFLGDFSNTIGLASGRDPYNDNYYLTNVDRIYPPLAYFLYYSISRFADVSYYKENHLYTYIYYEPKFLFVYLVGIFIIGGIFYIIIVYKLNSYPMLKYLFGLSLLLSFPFIFSLERGNLILFVIPLIMVFLFGYKSSNKIVKEVAFISLSIAAALKISPAIFGLLLLYEKKWKDAIRLLLYGVVLFFVPFLFLKGGINNIPIFINNIKDHMTFYDHLQGCGIYGSILSYGVKDSDALFTIISIITKLFFIFCLINSYISKRQSIRVLSLSLILIAVPSDSGIYCLLYLIPVLVFYFNEHMYRYDIIALVSYLIIMRPYMIQHFYKVFWFHTGLFLLMLYLIVEFVISIKKKKGVINETN